MLYTSVRVRGDGGEPGGGGWIVCLTVTMSGTAVRNKSSCDVSGERGGHPFQFTVLEILHLQTHSLQSSSEAGFRFTEYNLPFTYSHQTVALLFCRQR